VGEIIPSREEGITCKNERACYFISLFSFTLYLLSLCFRSIYLAEAERKAYEEAW